ncbi:hypothetical protein RND71_027358 [Anisodus tanguticus]|uniref:DUF3456 domain-containing protein n=1 Tax=Anisodus tanguticus TaxID=243964 RepID=A0AAE1RHS1_9SOLA|nr:hypothetical protein RND71_027358 [Anisodus tanguticus]
MLISSMPKIVIGRRVGELRVVELLEDLCEKMQDYTLEKVSKKLEHIQKLCHPSVEGREEPLTS